jgi:hypothetical protein
MKRESAAILMFAVLATVACSTGGTTAEAPAQAPAPAEAPAPAQPEAMDPVGSYTFSTTFQGMTVVGGIVIRGEPGSYTGMVEPTEGPPPVEIYSVTVEGRKITVYGDAGGDDLIMTMEFSAGNTYTGTWMLGFDSGELTGEKVQQ